MTVNEVEVAKNRKNEYRTLLAVVDGIDLSLSDGKWIGSNGRLRLWWDLVFSDESLFPTKYPLTLPKNEESKSKDPLERTSK